MQFCYDVNWTEEDNMANWDEAKLNDVITKKHGEAEKSKPKTGIVSKMW